MITNHVKAMALVLLVAGAVTTGLVIADGQPDQPISKPEAPPANAKAPAQAQAKAKPQAGAAQKAARKNKPAAPIGEDEGQGGPFGGAIMPMNGMGMSGQPISGAGMGGGGMMGGGMGGGQGTSGPGMGGGGMMMGGMGGGMARSEMLARRELQRRLEIIVLSAALDDLENNDETGAPKKKGATSETLEKPLPMSFASPTPLQDVLKYIKSATAAPNRKALPIYVDPKGLEQTGETLSSPVSIDVDGIPLKTSLRLVLKQLGLAYCVRDGVVIISSVEGIREELAEAAAEKFGYDEGEVDDIMQSMGLQTKRALQ
jgi:hypothetical protein